MSISTTIKSIQDIMRKDVGVDGDCAPARASRGDGSRWFGEDQSPIAIARALSPVLGALVIGGALMAVFRVKRLGWLFPLVVGLSFALHESIEWLSVARAIFWYEYNFAVSGLPAPFVERLVTLESIARALFFGAGVGATLQWHKLRAEDSDDEDDDDVSDDGMSFPIPSKADESG